MVSQTTMPNHKGLWLDSFGGLAVAEDTVDGIVVTRLRDGDNWTVCRMSPEIVRNVGPWTPVEVKPGEPIRLTSTPTDAQTNAAALVISRTLLDHEPSELSPADFFWVEYAALHALAAAANADDEPTGKGIA